MSKIIINDHGLEVLDGIAELFEEKSYLDRAGVWILRNPMQKLWL